MTAAENGFAKIFKGRTIKQKKHKTGWWGGGSKILKKILDTVYVFHRIYTSKGLRESSQQRHQESGGGAPKARDFV